MPVGRMLEQLYARRRFGIKPGVERVRLLLSRLGNPERSFRSIHVVGTNGKGSTSAFLSAILTAAGLRTALFTSPHLVNFSERFRIDGTEIPVELVEALLPIVLAAAPEDATFFEIVTALAAYYFAAEKVDIAVMEAGMGGRSDATAALPGLLTLITPVSLDHTAWLGGTAAEIAREKAAIAKPGTPVVIAPQPEDVRAALDTFYRQSGAEMIWSETATAVQRNPDGTIDYRGLHLQLDRLTPGLPGRYQTENAALALAAAEVLAGTGFTIREEAMRRGLAAARWPGRMETVPGRPPLLFDGAHNAAGAAALAGALADYRYARLLVVIGTMADKDVGEVVSPLASLASACYCVSPAVERALGDAELAQVIAATGVPAFPCGSVGDGIMAAQRAAAPEDLILICGSLFTVGEGKAWLAGSEFEGIRG